MPESRADSALTAPTISPVSPWTSEVQVTSPSILPSRWRSALAETSPLILVSAPRTEKVEPRIVLFPGLRGAAAGFFENMGGSFKEGARIDRIVVDPHFEVEVRPG